MKMGAEDIVLVGAVVVKGKNDAEKAIGAVINGISKDVEVFGNSDVQESTWLIVRFWQENIHTIMEALNEDVGSHTRDTESDWT